MKFIPTFFLLILIFTFTAHAQDDTRVSKTWIVQKYDLAATLPQNNTDRFLNIKANLDLRNAGTGAASRLTLRIAANAEVSTVKINGANVEFTKGEEKIGAETLQRIILRTPSVQPGEKIAVNVDYKLNVKENSGLNALSPDSAQFLPLSFWYPTPNSWFFARGGDFAPIRMQITPSAGQTIVSAGSETSGIFDQKLNGQPFFAAGNWDLINTGGVFVYVPKGLNAQNRAAELAALLNDAKSFTAGLLGGIPDVPLKIVAVRRGSGFSSGGTFLIDESVFRREKLDSQTVSGLAEAMAKLWLGDVYGVQGDGYGIIREGLSRYVAAQFIENKYGKDYADLERLRQRTAYAAISKRDAPLAVISPLDDYYFTANANKGAMIWRLLAKKAGQKDFYDAVKNSMKDGTIELSEIRNAFPAQKDFLDYEIGQLTDMDLLIGLPQVAGNETKLALRNIGSVEATVGIAATTAAGEKLTAQSTIPAKSFGEVIFKTTSKIVRAEIDTDKFYPQTDYSNDIVPRTSDDSDALLFVKRAFDKQDYAGAEKNARLVLDQTPLYDDVRTLLARSLMQQGKTAEAEKEFLTIINGKLPTARSLSWAEVGLGEIAAKSSQTSEAQKHFNNAITINGEYGASLAARADRNKLNLNETIDESIKSYFAIFDKTAISNRKADIDAIILGGEVSKFAGGIAGQSEQWVTQITHADRLDANNVLVEANLKIKLLNREPESGTAVFRLTKSAGNWKISGVEIFEVR